MNWDYNYSYEWDVKYCYPSSFVLRNRLNIANSEELNIAELEYTSLAIAEIKNNPIQGDFNLRHLQNIHKHVFADIYEWAGELRTVNISKGNAFCNYIYLADVSEDIFSKLKEENYLIGIYEENIYYKLAYYLGEVNALHPFREGNGRAQRILVEYLAQVAGYTIDFSNVTNTEMVEASVDSFNCNYTKMTELFKKITSPISREEQEDFIRKISLENETVMKVYTNVIRP